MGQDNSDELIASIAQPTPPTAYRSMAYTRNDSAYGFIRHTAYFVLLERKNILRQPSDLKLHLKRTPSNSISLLKFDNADGRESIQSILSKCDWSQRLDE